ncbi:MAG: Uma2 family endonuclease [Acidobacteria bacterium]|nr:Uma2 family endonuclease [Acidobacteriota bacterium]MBK8149012.1 Uma2 family endonuclease [Acidobacteriota bacterium]MBK8811630.1 Uma2 family endonuclease [Acidobacteriota bacterium]
MSEKILSQSEKIYTAEDYLRFERRDSGKKDRASGPTGSSRRHNLIGSNTTIAIGSRIRGQGKEVYVNDMRVKMSPNNYCYPDVIVVSGEPSFEGKELDILTNPTVIVEIMSRATLHQDKTEKLDRYLAIDSIKEIVLVKEEEMRVEHYHKQTINQWIYKIYSLRDDVISLDSINCKIALSEIYSQIRFEA